MPIAGLDHYNVATQDLEASRRFYIEVIGLVDGPRPLAPTRGAWLYCGERPIVHLSTRREVETRDTGRLDHIAFSAEDLPAMVCRLRAHGVEFDASPIPPFEDRPDSGGTQLFLADPDGVQIELNFGPHERLPE